MMERLFTILFCLVILTGSLSAQNNPLLIPQNGTTNVYFVNSGNREAVFYDYETPVAQVPLNKITKINTTPGKHLFFIAGNTQNFLSAELEPNSSYIIGCTIPTTAMLFGAVGALVSPLIIIPADPKKKMDVKGINKVFKKWKWSDGKVTQNIDPKKIQEAIARYEADLNGKQKNILKLTPDMKFETLEKTN